MIMPISKLEVGKRYRDRSGDVVEIFEKCILTTHPYAGLNGRYYRHNGSSGFFKESPHDLIEEVAKEPFSLYKLITNAFNPVKEAA